MFEITQDNQREVGFRLPSDRSTHELLAVYRCLFA